VKGSACPNCIYNRKTKPGPQDELDLLWKIAVFA
jgi:hypothetical protein